MYDDRELGFERRDMYASTTETALMRTEMADIYLKPRVHIKSSPGEAHHLSSQYRYGAEIPDSRHITMRIKASNPSHTVTRITLALVDCGATANFISREVVCEAKTRFY